MGRELVIENGNPFQAVVETLDTARELKMGEGYHSIARVRVIEEGLLSKYHSYFPLRPGQSFEPGQRIIIIPQTEKDPISGGSITRFELTEVK